MIKLPSPTASSADIARVSCIGGELYGCILLLHSWPVYAAVGLPIISSFYSLKVIVKSHFELIQIILDRFCVFTFILFIFNHAVISNRCSATLMHICISTFDACCASRKAIRGHKSFIAENWNNYIFLIM